MKYAGFTAIAGALMMTGLTSGCATCGDTCGPRGVDVIAHRGASAYAPENTLAAFQLAHEMGADWFELDCTLTKDGQVLVIHDDSVERTAGVKRHVSDMTLAELKELDAGSWKDPKYAGERLPTLAEALDLAKGKIGVYIEVKNAQNDDDLQAAILELAADYQVLPDKVRREMMARIEADGTRNLELTRKVIALVRERKMKKEIVIQSFSPIVCAIASSEAPELRVELLTGAKLDDPGAWERSLRWAYLLGLGGVNPCKDGVDTGRLAALHAGGKCVAVWTVNSHLEMGQLAGWGVDRIITDRPDVCVDTLKKTGER